MIDEFDVIEGTPITERFVTRDLPTVDGTSAIILGVKLTPKDNIIPDIKVVDAPSHTSDKTEKVYCIDYTLPKGAVRFEATIEVE